jgi:adenylate cyclase
MLAEVESWLIREGRMLDTPEQVVGRLCEHLASTGLAPLRVQVQLQTLHPLVAARMFVWRRHDTGSRQLSGMARIVDHHQVPAGGGAVQSIGVAHGGFESVEYLQSPLVSLYAGRASIRCPVPPGDGPVEFPILADLRAVGGTDYVAMGLRFSAGRLGTASVATDRPGGFTDAETEAIIGLAPALSACFDAHLANHVARTLLDTYVGRLTGERVLAGRIMSGDVERLEAAIWFSDLRGFTSIAGTVEPSELIAWLNDYFDAVCAPIAAHGGEVLKFIGDAVLAVFPVEEDPRAACRAARSAAAEAHARLDALNARRAEQGLDALRHGIALHVGEVQYGNIGAASRLDFTVIGPAVNATSRLEGLCARLGKRTVASRAFAELAGDGLVQLGAFELKGIAAPEIAFGEP